MSFVPNVAAIEAPKEDVVLACVNCPVKALSKEGKTYYCSHNFSISKHVITKTVIGDIVTDVIDNCKKCSLHNKVIETKEIPVTNNCVTCPMVGGSSQVKDCGKCACLNYAKTLTHIQSKGKGDAVDKIFCNFPDVTFTDISVKFTPTKKRNIKSVRELMKGGKNA